MPEEPASAEIKRFNSERVGKQRSLSALAVPGKPVRMSWRDVLWEILELTITLSKKIKIKITYPYYIVAEIVRVNNCDNPLSPSAYPSFCC